MVFRVIAAVRERETKTVIDGLESSECDVLMKVRNADSGTSRCAHSFVRLPMSCAHHRYKYLYKGLELANNCGAMLKWHELLTAKAGQGTIMRAMTDTRGV